MHTASDGKRYYDDADGERLEGQFVICDWARDGKCDGEKCNHYHDKPHIYHDIELECFISCGHDGKDGMCVLTDGNGAGQKGGVIMDSEKLREQYEQETGELITYYPSSCAERYTDKYVLWLEQRIAALLTPVQRYTFDTVILGRPVPTSGGEWVRYDDVYGKKGA